MLPPNAANPQGLFSETRPTDRPMVVENQSDNSRDCSLTDSAAPVHVLALSSRTDDDYHCLQNVLRTRFAKARITYLLPDTYAENLLQDSRVEQVLSYGERDRANRLERLRVLFLLRRRIFHYCVLPFDARETPRYYRLFFLILLLRIRCLLLLDPDEKTQPWRKTGLLKVFARSFFQQAYEKWEPRIRVLYYSARNGLVDLAYAAWLLLSRWINRMEDRMGEHFDIPIWIFLIYIAKAHVFVSKRVRKSLFKKHRSVQRAPRVAHFISSLDMGGVQRQLLTFLTKSDSMLPHASLFVYDPFSSRFESRFEERGYAIKRIKRRAEEFEGGGYKRFVWAHFPTVASALRLRSFLKKDGGHAVLHNWEFRANTIGSVAAALAGTPVILSSVRNMSSWKKTWDRRWWYRAADRLTAGLNDRIVANAEAVKSDYRKWACIKEEKIVTIPNGLDFDSIPEKDVGMQAEVKQELGWDSSLPVIGWVGRFAPQKDPDAFLRFTKAYLEMQGEAGFVMLGDGPLLSDIRKCCGPLKLDDRVRFLGARMDVYRWMQAMDVLVMTSIIEGMPNVLMEALFMGIPCVTTDAGGAREVVEEGQSGFVVPVGDIQGLVDRCGRILSEPALQHRFTKAGRERARRLFGAETMVRETIRLYHRLLERE